MPERGPERVNFNFLAKCNMSCPYCYCPFDGEEGDVGLWKKIVDRIVSWGCFSITFGGGDPFLYSEFSELLTHANKRRGLLKFIQVDTNGIGVRAHHYPSIKENVDLLGLPLDGSDNATHGLMRSNLKHFDKVINLLTELSRMSVPIKINTVVSRRNVDDLGDLLELLSHFQIRIWSLYEFWPLGLYGSVHKEEYAVPHELFLERAQWIRETCEFAQVEIGSIDKRSRAYFFVSQTGRAYAIKSSNVEEYVELGSVFDDEVIDRWDLQADRSQMLDRVVNRII
jgi:MoaA/NifB/PqqE/SkfB family radical SAM enzyme